MNALIKRLLYSDYFIITLVPLYLLAIYSDRPYQNYVFLLILIILAAVRIYRIRTGHGEFTLIDRIVGPIVVFSLLLFYYLHTH